MYSFQSYELSLLLAQHCSESPSQMFQKEKEAPQNVEMGKFTPHRSHLHGWQWWTQAVRHWFSYVFQAYFRIQHLKVYMSKNNRSLLSVSAAPGDRRGCCDVLGTNTQCNVFPASKSSVGGDYRLKSCRCLHPCTAPGEKLFFSNIHGEPVSRRWC